MKTLTFKKLMRKAYSALSFTTVLFIFQACYGMPQDLENDIFIEGIVKSSKTGQPVQGIKITFEDLGQNVISNENGQFSLYARILEQYRLHIEDTDSLANGNFISKDTVLDGTKSICPIEIILQEK